MCLYEGRALSYNNKFLGKPVALPSVSPNSNSQCWADLKIKPPLVIGDPVFCSNQRMNGPSLMSVFEKVDKYRFFLCGTFCDAAR